MNPTYQHYATHDESEFPHLWRGVVGAWAPCLGPSGTRLHDHSGRANWGTLTNMNPAEDWLVNGGQYAIDFDGVNDHVVSSRVVNVRQSTQTIWFRVSSYPTTTAHLCGFINGLNSLVVEKNIVLRSNGTCYGYCFDTAARITPDSAIVDLNTWAMASLSLDGVNAKIWLNGKEQASIACTTPDFSSFYTVPNLFVSGNSLVQGAGAIGSFLFAEYILHDRALSASEFAELYQIGRGGMYTPRRRRRAYSFGPSFLAAWARGSNVILQPCGVS